MLIYLRESVTEVATGLKDKNFYVDYKAKPDDSEYHNAYICRDAGLKSIVALVSSTIRWRQARPEWDIPEGSKSCVQMTEDFGNLVSFIEMNFDVLKKEE